MRRALLLAAALSIPVTGASLALAGGTAVAGVKIVCTNVNGTVSGTITISGCTGGVTGGSSTATPTSTLATGGVIHWVSGSTTTFGAPTLVSTLGKKCPGYVKGASSNPTQDKFSGAVTADTGDGLKVPGKYAGVVCVSSSGNITAEPGKDVKAS